MVLHQVDCFNMNMKFFKFLAIWPSKDFSRYYNYYAKAFITIFIVIYFILFSINFYYLPRQLDIFIEEMIFYFTEVGVTSKMMTFILMPNKVIELLERLESDVFQPDNAEGLAILKKSKKFIRKYWKVQVTVSYISSAFHLISPLFTHFILGAELLMPVCRYSFVSDEYMHQFLYLFYLYQSLGIHFHMMYNVSIDSFLLGLMVLAIAQLEILDNKLRTVTNRNYTSKDPRMIKNVEADIVIKLNQCIKHFNEVCRYCELLEETFSMTLFVQFSVASVIICVCLVRFTMPAPFGYYVFLATYMSLMIIGIMIPCWFGTKIIYKSQLLGFSTYNCDWTPRSRQFKSNMRFFIDRVNKPLSITGGKMFCLSLDTFTSIMNSAYSFFTLLKNFQHE